MSWYFFTEGDDVVSERHLNTSVYVFREGDDAVQSFHRRWKYIGVYLYIYIYFKHMFNIVYNLRVHMYC